MNKNERDDFRCFCQQATDNQLISIVAKERELAEHECYHQVCAGIAEAIASERGLEID